MNVYAATSSFTPTSVWGAAGGRTDWGTGGLSNPGSGSSYFNNNAITNLLAQWNQGNFGMLSNQQTINGFNLGLTQGDSTGITMGPGGAVSPAGMPQSGVELLTAAYAMADWASTNPVG